jgi:hypothetical protein
MNDAVFIQTWFTPDYGMLIDMTKARHQRYCDKWSVDLWLNDLSNEKLTTGVKCFRDIETIKQALDKGYKYVISSDVDVIIWDFDKDLRDACVDIRGVRFDTMRVKHVNIGIMYIQDCDLTRAFIRAWEPMAKTRINDQFGAQNAFNWVTKQHNIPPLNCTWNYCYTQHKWIDRPAVRGYHDLIGYSFKLAKMQADMEECGG